MVCSLLQTLAAAIRMSIIRVQEGWNASQRSGRDSANGAVIRSIWLADPAEETGKGNNHIVWTGLYQFSVSPKHSSLQSTGDSRMEFVGQEKNLLRPVYKGQKLKFGIFRFIVLVIGEGEESQNQGKRSYTQQ